MSRYGPLALAGSTKTVKVFLEDKATGRRVREAVRDAAATAGVFALALNAYLSDRLSNPAIAFLMGLPRLLFHAPDKGEDFTEQLRQSL